MTNTQRVSRPASDHFNHENWIKLWRIARDKYGLINTVWDFNRSLSITDRIITQKPVRITKIWKAQLKNLN